MTKNRKNVSQFCVTLSARVNLSELDPLAATGFPEKAKGGVAGFAKGSAKVDLVESERVTLLSYQVEARSAVPSGRLRKFSCGAHRPGHAQTLTLACLR